MPLAPNRIDTGFGMPGGCFRRASLFYFLVGGAEAGAGDAPNPELMLRAPSDMPNSRQRLLTH